MKRENFNKQQEIPGTNPIIDINQKIDNIIYESNSEEDKWIQETTEKIGDWRGIFKSAYMKWAISINGLFLGKERYEKNSDNELFRFKINSLRNGASGFEQSVIAEWGPKMAAKVHFDTIPLICSYGFIDLYNCLEEFVFDFYRIYWSNNPEKFIRGKEFRKLRILRNNSSLNDESMLAWQNAFNERLDKWQRKKMYDGLGKVFLSYCNEAGLKKPKTYSVSSPETWAESISGISLIRNTIVHGGKTVSSELAEFCKKPYSLNLNFKEGEELAINLTHLQSLELFTTQILSALNLSLMERVLDEK